MIALPPERTFTFITTIDDLPAIESAIGFAERLRIPRLATGTADPAQATERQRTPASPGPHTQIFAPRDHPPGDGKALRTNWLSQNGVNKA